MLLALFFYSIVTPVGLVRRLLGKDPLRLKYAPAAASYWIDRAPPGPNPETMRRQF